MPSSRANQGTPDATPTTGERQLEGRGVGPPPKGAGPLDALRHRTDRSTAQSSVAERPGLRQLASDAEEFHLPLALVELLADGIVDAGERSGAGAPGVAQTGRASAVGRGVSRDALAPDPAESVGSSPTPGNGPAPLHPLAEGERT